MCRTKESLFSLFAAILVLATLPHESSAQVYPSKPIRLLVGFPPGGGTDVTARLVAQRLSETVAQPVIVENRPGASATIAVERVTTSIPDGHTLLMTSSTDTAQPALRSKLPYDLERDLAPVSLLGMGPFVLVVHPSVPVHTLKEVIAFARSQPGKLNYASAGVGSALHLAGELFNQMARVTIAHVPYKGASEVVVATASGQVTLSFVSVTGALSLLGAGKLRPIAVTTTKRWPPMPYLPTLNEGGLHGYDSSIWYGVAGPAGLSKDIISRLNALLAKVVNTTDMREEFYKQGLEPLTNTPDQFATFFRNQIAESAKLIKVTGAKAD